MNIETKYTDPSCDGTLKVELLESGHVTLYAEDANGNHAKITLSDVSGIGKVISDYIQILQYRINKKCK